MSILVMTGLAGDNPLAYMAALGALVTADSIFREQGPVTLRWEPLDGAWRPLLEVPGEVSEDELAGMLHGKLHRDGPVAAQAQVDEAKAVLRDAKAALKQAQLTLKAEAKARKLKKGSAQLEALAAQLVEPAESAVEQATATLESAQARLGALDPAKPVDPSTALAPHLKAVAGADFARFAALAGSDAQRGNRRLADLAAAFGCELVTDKEGRLEPTRFSKNNGAANKHMLLDVALLMQLTSTARIAAALFRPWDYADAKRSLGWDPLDARPYAHLAENPETKGSFTMHGANLLAYEALALFPTSIRGHKLATTGTTRIGRVSRFTWPIWAPAVGASVIRSVIAHPELHRESLDHKALGAIGIVEVFGADHYGFTDKKIPRLRAALAI